MSSARKLKVVSEKSYIENFRWNIRNIETFAYSFFVIDG